MRIVMAGASGFLGSRLSRALLADGHEVVRLVRRQPSTPAERAWYPDRGLLDPAVIAGTDAVINLGGANIGGRRWTESYRRTLRESRVGPTALISRTLAALPDGQRARVLLNASGVDYYGDTGGTIVTEGSPAGAGFLAHLCQDWEAATSSARAAGVRVVPLRTGLPLDPGGGLLQPLLLPFKLGLGGHLGSGRQYVPWISMRDWLDAVRFLLDRPDITGPVNVVGPAPVTNTVFAKALGRALHRPAFWPIPRVALAVVAGELANDVVASRRALPKVLLDAGFGFQDLTVDAALAAALSHDRATGARPGSD